MTTLEICENRPLAVIDKGAWNPWALNEMGLE